MSTNTTSIGELARLACTWEVRARKAGNVCPDREFGDLTVADFLLSAAAVAPVLDRAPTQPLGATILRCIEETRKVTATNTNLGIVLLLAPLASVPLEEPLRPGLARLLARTTVDDSRQVYAAIRLAEPSGLGEVKEQDIADEPTLTLREVMTLAAEDDLIAAQYANDFALVDAFAVDLIQRVTNLNIVERAIVETQRHFLATCLDSHIVRKCGEAAALQVQQTANAITDLVTTTGRQAYLDFDRWLRSDNHARNPGTIADLIAAGLFLALRARLISSETPFVWNEHPFIP